MLQIQLVSKKRHQIETMDHNIYDETATNDFDNEPELSRATTIVLKSKSKSSTHKCQRRMLKLIAPLLSVLGLCAGVTAVIIVVFFRPEIGTGSTSRDPNVTTFLDLTDKLNDLQELVRQFSISPSPIEPSEVEALSERIDDLNEQFEQIYQIVVLASVSPTEPSIGSFTNPASSCRDIPEESPSGQYWINSTEDLVQVYCDMNRTNCNCNSTTSSRWMRVANLNMTDPSQSCPAGFRLVPRTSAPLRTCGRPASFFRPESCISTMYQTFGIPYSRVCGRITGYHDKTPDAFRSYLPIDFSYVDGISLTYGRPRQHIWSFAGFTPQFSPEYVAYDFFCHDIAPPEAFTAVWAEPERCYTRGVCCEFNNPPWFCKELPQPTTDDIELRLCGDQNISDEDTPIELVELYVS